MRKYLNKPPLKRYLEVADTKYYDYDGTNLKSPRPWKYPEREMMYPGFQEWNDNLTSNIAKNDIEANPEVDALFDEAIGFVQQLTGYYLTDVSLKMSTEGVIGSVTAKYSPTDNTVRYFGEYSVNDNSPEGDYNRHVITGLFVHELMHATNRNNYKAIGVRGSESGMRVQLVSGLASVDMRGSTLETYLDGHDAADIRVGRFFEEAAAEEAAARWREGVMGYDSDATYHFNASTGLPSMPQRYVYIRSDFIDGANGSGMAASAYCAESMRLVSAHTGTDLFELMLQSRDVQKEASARREIAKAIESVQKGLYTRLRDASYTPESFRQCYEKVVNAIANDNARKNTIGRLATSA